MRQLNEQNAHASVTQGNAHTHTYVSSAWILIKQLVLQTKTIKTLITKITTIAKILKNHNKVNANYKIYS